MTTELQRTIIRVGTVDFDACTHAEAIGQVIRAAANREPVSVHLSNAYCVALASSDPEYRNVLRRGGYVYPDGTPVAIFMKSRNPAGRRVERVRGPSLFVDSLSRTVSRNVSNFFLGSTNATLEKLEAEVRRQWPDIKIAGKYSPAFGPVDQSFIDDASVRIVQSGADLVWVALGTPKQDQAALELAEQTGIPCVAVGAAFDFVAGTVKEAPVWMQRSGTEWLYRLATEPRRLWRRYLIGNPRFLYSAIIETKKNR